MKGRIERHEGFSSLWVPPRNVDVWVPPEYEEDPHRQFPVVYMHDGQNLFNPAESFAGVEWGVHRAMAKLSHEEHVEPAIIVGIWNTSERIPEYMPERPMREYATGAIQERFRSTYGGDPRSDHYLAFLVREVKPYVDARYRTRKGRDDTSIMGSSMGGLISLYAICEYPDTFGRAGCLSTSWTIAGALLLQYLKVRMPRPREHKLYFDYGVEAQIARYEQLQRKVDRIVLDAGFERDTDWTTERFPGAPHSESAWSERVDVPLRFLLA